FGRVTGVRTTESTRAATIVQTRHRIPETPLREGQIMVYQVPIPEPLRWLEPSETETRTMHALAEYGSMHVKLYEDIAQHGHIATTYDYPVIVNGRYIMRPSPIPKFDNPKLDRSPALMLFGAGREKRVYAVPPYTRVKSLDFDDHPFRVEQWDQCCDLCGSRESYLDEIILDDQGTRRFVCSDTEYCADRRAHGHLGAAAPAAPEAAARTANPCFACATWPAPGTACTAAATSASTCTPAKCCAWWASPARARARCCRQCRGRPGPSPAVSGTTPATAASSTWRRCRPRTCACWPGPTGASCGRMRAMACACRSAPAPISPSA